METHPVGLVAGARRPIETVTAARVAAAYARGKAILLDLREPDERWRQGVIPGAVHSPWGTLAFWDELTNAYYRAKRDRAGRVILYCASGGRSARAASTLRQMGYANVTSLEGGFAAWKAANWPVEDVPAA